MGCVASQPTGKGGKLFAKKNEVTAGAKMFTSRKRQHTSLDSIERYVRVVMVDRLELVDTDGWTLQ
jgi:hypothetical protein